MLLFSRPFFILYLICVWIFQGVDLTSFLSASDSPLFCVVGPPSLRCLSIIKYGRNNVQCPKKTRSTSLGITFILYQMNRILWKLCWKKNVRSSLSLYSIRQQNSQSQPLRKKKRKQATNVQFVSENIVRMIGHGSNFLRPRKKWPLLYNRPINMKTIRDYLSLSSLHFSYSVSTTCYMVFGQLGRLSFAFSALSFTLLSISFWETQHIPFCRRLRSFASSWSSGVI